MKSSVSFFLAIIMLSIQVNLFAQTRAELTGKVVHAESGSPLPGATIRVHDVNRDVISDEQGHYRVANLPAGKYLVEVSYVGHETIVESIEIDGIVERNFGLVDAVVEQEGVTVTGVSTATRLRQSPQPVAIIKRNELIKTSSSNIIQSLTQIPGVNALTSGPAVSKPFIRGLGYNRVVVVNDGMRQEGQQWGDEHGIEVDDYSVQKVEVLKGPSSLMYGSDALAGVINIQSQLPATANTIRANVLSEYQTNSRLRGVYGSVAGMKNGFGFSAYGSYKAAADYRNKYDGPVFNSKFNNMNFGGMLGYGGSWGHSYLRLSRFNQHTGMIEGERDDATGAFLKPVPGGGEEIALGGDFNTVDPLVPYQHIDHFKVSSDNSFNIGRSRLDVLAGFQRNQRKEFGDPDNLDEPEAFFDLKTVNYSVKLNLPYRGYWRTSTGVSGMLQTNTNRGEEALIPDYDLFDIGGFVFAQYHKDKWSLSGGLRFDSRRIDGKELMDGTEIKFAPFSKNFSNVSGSAGVSYEANKELTLKLNVARGFRAPTLEELASNGAHEGTNRFEIGNRNLKSETSLQIDGAVELNTEHITLGAGIFFNSVKNFIYYEKVLNNAGNDSLIIDPDSGDPLMVFRFDQQSATLYGAEFNMDIHPHPLDWLHFENTFSLTRARFNDPIDGSANVPNIPSARLISQLKGNFLPKGKQLRNIYLSLESDYNFRQNHAFAGYNTETTTPGYWLVGISAGTDVMHRGKTLFSLHLTGTNLGDVAYQNHLSRLKYTAVNNVTGRQGVFNVGRNFGLKVNVPLDFEWK